MINFSCCRSASTADSMSGYCSLQARLLPSRETARCTWPSEAACAASCSKLLNLCSQSGPSSLAMRRLTKGQPIGGALDWSLASSSAYSCGQRVGDGGESCATFISGPLRPPSADLRSAAWRPRSRFDAEIARRRPAARRARPSRSKPARSAAPGRQAVSIGHGGYFRRDDRALSTANMESEPPVMVSPSPRAGR